MPFLDTQSLNVYPAECVIGTIEIKSKLNVKELNKSIISAAKVHEYVYDPSSIYRTKTEYYTEIYNKYKPLSALFAFDGNKCPILSKKDMSNKEAFVEKKEKASKWLSKHVKYLSFICQANRFSVSTIREKYVLSYADETNKEIVRFMATFLDNIRHLSDARYFSSLGYYDLLGIYIRDQPSIRAYFTGNGRGPRREWHPSIKKTSNGLLDIENCKFK